MIWDAQSLFEPLAGTAITASGTSSNIIDLGGGGGLSAGAIRGGRVLAQIGQAFNNLTSLNVALQGAPDNGSGSPGTFKTLIETGAIPLSSLITGTKIAQWRLPGILQSAALPKQPRFLQLAYTVSGTAPTAGTLIAGVLADIDANSAYAAGIAVAN